MRRKDFSPLSQDHVSPELRRLFALCASDPHAAEFLRFSVRANAARIVDDFHAHCEMMTFDPPWLLRVLREVLRALETSHAR